ncbi:MAG: CrcB protein [Pseudonocardiales bacterium]|nr:CrcB protein [Pseudonocardiales bacterium]
MTVLMVAIGAAIGAPARYVTDQALRTRYPTRFPLGTLIVNVIASFVLGVVVGLGSHLDNSASSLLGAGFCGALSTYSTFSYETMRLGENGAGRLAVGNVTVSLVTGIGAAALGWRIGLSLN